MSLAEAVATFGPALGVPFFLAWAYWQRQPPRDPTTEIIKRLEQIETKTDNMEVRMTDRLARIETNIDNMQRARR